jgi:hypothetical protein
MKQTLLSSESNFLPMAMNTGPFVDNGRFCGLSLTALPDQPAVATVHYSVPEKQFRDADQRKAGKQEF